MRKDKIKEIIKQVALEEDLPESTVEDIYGAIWLITKKILKSKWAPRVRLDNFGSFIPKMSHLNRALKGYLSRFRNGKITREQMESRVKTYWVVRRRMQKETKRNPKSKYYKRLKYNKDVKDAEKRTQNYLRSKSPRGKSPQS